MCGIAGIVRPPTGRGRWTRSACCGWRARCATAAPTASGSRSTRAPAWSSTRLAIFDIPGGWQPIEDGQSGGLIVYNGEVYNHPELRAELEARGERVRDDDATPRSCCACSSATASPRSTGSTASSRSPGGSRRSAA